MDRRLRARTYRAFAPNEGGTVGVVLDWAITVLIVLNVIAAVVGTVDSIATRYDGLFRTFEVVSVVVFSVEYVARVWSIVEADAYDGTIGRLRFVSQPLPLVDLAAIAPFYLAAVAGTGIDLRFLRALRLFRLARVLKLVRYSESIRSFREVLRRKRSDLAIVTLANGLLLVVSSSLLYYLERGAQPEAFGSIPEAMWWGIVTLTTVGYGTVVPETALGRLVGGLVAVVGIGLFALPASVLASGFIEVAVEDGESRRNDTYETGLNDEYDRGRSGQHDRNGDHATDSTVESDPSVDVTDDEVCPHCGRKLG